MYPFIEIRQVTATIPCLWSTSGRFRLFSFERNQWPVCTAADVQFGAENALLHTQPCRYKLTLLPLNLRQTAKDFRKSCVLSGEPGSSCVAVSFNSLYNLSYLFLR